MLNLDINAAKQCLAMKKIGIKKYFLTML